MDGATAESEAVPADELDDGLGGVSRRGRREECEEREPERLARVAADLERGRHDRLAQFQTAGLALGIAHALYQTGSAPSIVTSVAPMRRQPPLLARPRVPPCAPPSE